MLVILLIILGISIYGMEYAGREEYYRDYMSLEKTRSVKGIFTLLVFLSHFVQYIELDRLLDKPYIGFRDFLGQLVVTNFLFYSGYGILESIKKKGDSYVDNIPRDRILRVLFDFDLAVLIFLLVGLLLGSSYDLRRILLSFTGWTSVGNSSWYIFVILLSYLFSYLSFKVFKENYLGGIAGVGLLSLGYILLVRDLRPSYFYNTILSYVWGMVYSLYRRDIEDFFMGRRRTYRGGLLIFSLIFLVSYLIRNKFLSIQVRAICFIGLLILSSMKLSFNNPILNWIGDHLFTIYILQRIPMMLLKEVAFISSRRYLYLGLTAVLTGLIASAFTAFSKKLHNKLFLKQ